MVQTGEALRPNILQFERDQLSTAEADSVMLEVCCRKQDHLSPQPNREGRGNAEKEKPVSFQVENPYNGFFWIESYTRS